jgi:Bacterial Ig domain
MKNSLLNPTRILAVATALLGAGPAHAVLRDHGPIDPVLAVPQWYRDLNGTAVGLCKSQAQSPNPAAALKPMCFPLAADPAGFPGNLGGEIFYADNVGSLASGGYSLKYTAALEFAYIPGPVPTHGTEAVFARLRFLMTTDTAGDYTVTHPFGVEVFPGVGTGKRSLFFTIDVPLGVTLDFESALTGRLGPFLQWDFLNAGETLTIGAEQFLGDANYAHTFTGSPFGTNFIRVDGPAGFTGVPGETFLQTPLAVILGQKWTAPIPTALKVARATYSRTATQTTVDVWASSAPGQKMVLTGAGMPSLQMKADAAGNYYAHLAYPSAIPPASVTVTNMTSVPVNGATVALSDAVNIVGATYDGATGAFSVSATTSDAVAPPAIAVLGPLGGLMAPGATQTFTRLIGTNATVIPPLQINVLSSGGGRDVDDVVILPGAPMNQAGAPTAADQAPVVAGSGPTTFSVLAGGTVTGVPTVLLLTQPAQGTAVNAALAGSVTFTPSPGAQGADGFLFAIQDSTGLISNVATVTLNIPFVAPPPTANADNFAMQQNTAKTVSVLANDVAGAGTTINPASVLVSTPPAHGTATVNANGTITYRPTANFNGALDTFAYTVANTAGTRSAPATVTVDVFGGPEAVSFSRVEFRISTARWTIIGATNWFNAALTQTTATCFLTSSGGVPIAPTLIGSAPVDATGKFSVVPLVAPTAVATATISCQTSDPAGPRATATSSVVFRQ